MTIMRQMYPMSFGQDSQSFQPGMVPFVASPRPRRMSQSDITANATRYNALNFNANQAMAGRNTERATALQDAAGAVIGQPGPTQQGLIQQSLAAQMAKYGGNLGYEHTQEGSRQLARAKYIQKNIETGPTGGKTAIDYGNEFDQHVWPTNAPATTNPTQSVSPIPQFGPPSPFNNSQSMIPYAPQQLTPAEQSKINNDNFVPGMTRNRIGITEGTLQGLAIRGAQQGMTPEQIQEDVGRFAAKYGVKDPAVSHVQGQVMEGQHMTPYYYDQNNQEIKPNDPRLAGGTNQWEQARQWAGQKYAGQPQSVIDTMAQKELERMGRAGTAGIQQRGQQQAQEDFNASGLPSPQDHQKAMKDWDTRRTNYIDAAASKIIQDGEDPQAAYAAGKIDYGQYQKMISDYDAQNPKPTPPTVPSPGYTGKNPNMMPYQLPGAQATLGQRNTAQLARDPNPVIRNPQTGKMMRLVNGAWVDYQPNTAVNAQQPSIPLTPMTIPSSVNPAASPVSPIPVQTQELQKILNSGQSKKMWMNPATPLSQIQQPW
jgi:hypothetical protein